MNITESEEILKSIKNADGIIIRWHSFGDHSLLRRELYDAFLMDRTPDCHEYWVHEE